MKRLILIIFIMQGILCPVMAYQSSVYGSSRVAGAEYRKIGYTTNYANGQFNSSYYKTNSSSFNGRVSRSSVAGGVYYVRTIGEYGYYNGTYTPTSGTSGRPSGPRRITVYNGNGNTKDTPGGDSDPEGVYRYDETTNTWYYSLDNGETWYEWRKAEGFWERFVGLFGGGWGNDWRTYNGTQENLENNTGKWASDPNDPFLEPIDSPIIPFSILAIGYVIYKKKEERTC